MSNTVKPRQPERAVEYEEMSLEEFGEEVGLALDWLSNIQAEGAERAMRVIATMSDVLGEYEKRLMAVQQMATPEIHLSRPKRKKLIVP